MRKDTNTYYEIYYHIVFSTKNRAAMLDENKIRKIRQIAARKAEELSFLLHALNGYKDHIHILLTIPPALALSTAIKHIKGTSSHALPDVYWQKGHYAKTLHREIFDTTNKYIQNQWYRHESKELRRELEIEGWME